MRFNVILADPPWPYADPRTHASMGHARSAYDCMPLEDIKALSVPDIAAKDCMLALWATMPKLPEALAVIEAWGFRYITCGFVWVKTNPKSPGIYSGLGHWVNGNAELVLFGRKGRPIRQAKDIKQIVVAARGAHSVKPIEVAGRLERLFGEVPRIELFARAPRVNWTCVGKAIDGKDIAVALADIAS